jgi:hypothetical protein
LTGIRRGQYSNPQRQVKPGNQKNANKTGFHFSTADGFHHLFMVETPPFAKLT